MGHDQRHPADKAYRVVTLTFDEAGTAKRELEYAKSGDALSGFAHRP